MQNRGVDLITETYTVLTADERSQFEAYLLTYRELINEALDGLTEDEARRRLVPSKTTLLGLVKHAAYVEQVWFVEALTGTPRAELGLPTSVDESYDLDDSDTVASIRAAHRRAFEASARAAAELALDDTVDGHRLGAMSLRWIYLHVLREMAQHVGHAEILREQVLAERSSAT